MTRPTVAPDWATNAAYGAGARPWNSQPNKTQPSAGVIAEGFDPENPLAADFLNWVLNNHGGWLSYIDALTALGVFGSGADGDIDLDGVVTPSYVNLSGGVYSLLRDVNFGNLTLHAPLVTNGFRIYATGTATTNGHTISANGAAGQDDNIGPSGGVGASPNTVFGGASGGTSTATNGGAGSNQTNSLGGNGGAGGAGTGGTAGAGGTISAAAASRGSSRTSFGQWMGHALGISGSASTPIAFTGGAGGGAGGGTGSVAGAGGGGGGGLLMISARSLVLTNASDLQAYGGKGGDATVSTHGAGGGGGGGYVRIVCVDLTVGSGSLSVSANCAGGARGVNGGDASRDGVAGSNGTLETVLFSSNIPIPPLGTAQEEEGFVNVNTGDTSADIIFSTAFAAAPGSVGGYAFNYTVMRTDGVVGAPATVVNTFDTGHVLITILDSFQGVICWRASTK